MNILDFIFPRKCINCRKFGDFLCSDCFSKISFDDMFICPGCYKASINGITHPSCKKSLEIDGILTVVKYNKIVKKLISQYKDKPYISELSKIISELMIEGLSQNEEFYKFIVKYNPVVIPVPSSKKEIRERGYDYIKVLASYVAQYFKLRLNPKILVRTNDAKLQDKKVQIRNTKETIGIAKNVKFPSSIILIDDITTTFSTLREATRALKATGAKRVLGIALVREV